MEIFQYQAKNNAVYSEFLNLLKIEPTSIQKVEHIPFIPIEFFKTRTVVSGKLNPEAIVFKSSGTTDTGRSKHHVIDPSVYERSFRKGFAQFYGPSEDYVILALLPSYLEQGESSLVYMINDFIESNPNPESQFYLNNFEELATELKALETSNKKTILIGVTYALLDFCEQHPQELKKTIVMETGGMKGRRTELIREDLHLQLCNGLGVTKIHSEYGMTELLAQAYSKGDGIFQCPQWMKIQFRESTNPLYSNPSLDKGIVNIIDLSNVNSCSFIATQDLGKLDGNGFQILGRTDASDIRGCSQLFL